MKYFTRQGLYKASNVTFNPETVQAFSYGWWNFVSQFQGKVIFNTFPYSNTTRRHQWKVRRQMEQLGLRIDFEVDVPQGISPSGCIKAIDHYKFKIEEVKSEMARGRPAKNEEREKIIKFYRGKIRELNAIIALMMEVANA